jgi:hypothetical protein
MEDIRSGKELCDNFFENLPKREDIDSQVANLLKELYNAKEFKKENLLLGLQSLRQDNEHE